MTLEELQNLITNSGFNPDIRVIGMTPRLYRQRGEEIQQWIDDNITSTDTYKENILEITLDGKYKEAEDGTKIVIEPGETRTYIIYTKQ